MAVPSFGNIGINYAVAGADWAADAALFKATRKYQNKPIPLNIVCNNARVSVPWVQGTPDGNGNFADGRAAAIFFAADPAFDVAFNIWYGPTTADSWSDGRAAMIQEAQYLQSLALPYPIEIGIGNELTGSYGILEGGIVITRSGTTATCVLPYKFQTHVGDTFTIFQSNHAEYNGVKTVLSYDGARTVTFSANTTDAASAGGNAYSISIAQLNVLIRTLATDMKSNYTNGRITYNEFNGLVNGLYAYDDWVSTGLGDLDRINIHIYPGLFGKPPYGGSIAQSAGSNAALAMISTFGSRCTIGELNMSASSISYSRESVIANAQKIFKDILLFTNIPRVTIWSWNTNLAMRNQTTKVYSPAWGVFVSGNGRLSLDMYAQTRPTLASRPAAVTRPLANSRPAI